MERRNNDKLNKKSKSENEGRNNEMENRYTETGRDANTSGTGKKNQAGNKNEGTGIRR